ncbi:MAG: FAD-dependent monooxygenase [Rhizonema sp. PD37]|nr:FAD-dependent monooxygenase [Rhizonema sp. PD37]
MPAQTNRHIPVLIVGAGPTGLTMAATLTKYGVPVRIVEKKPNLSRFTKATNLMQRSQEVLYALNLLEAMNDIGGFMCRLMVHSYGKCFGPLTMRLEETPFKDVILCGQHNFEAVIAKALELRGISIEFNTELKHLQQIPNSVVATLQGSGTTEEIQCDYVIGCDGATGITRTFTKYDFEPKKTGVSIRQIDCKLKWRRLSTMDQLWLFYFKNGFATVVPLPGGMHRVLTIEPKDCMPERNPTLEEMQTRIREITTDDSVVLSDPEWFSYTDLSMGIASGLRDGRIILTGDVGNPILPNGGQGMNTGISDAFNLGWKLASTLKHGAPDVLIDTYEQERHTLRTKLQNTQYFSLKYTTLVTPKWMQALLCWLGEPLLRWGGEYKMAQAFSQLTINTRESPLTLEKMGTKGLRAGDRALNADISKDTETVQIYELIYVGGWTLLAFTGTKEINCHALIKAINTFGRADLSRYVVSTHSQIASTVPILYDLDEVAHRTYQVKKPTLYLIRPDGYVGARVSPTEVGRLSQYATRWIPQGTLSLAFQN